MLDTFETMPYTKIDAISMDPVDPMPMLGGTVMLKNLSPEVIDDFLSIAGPGQNFPLLMVETRDLHDMDTEDQRARIAGQPIFAAGIPFNEEVAMAITAGIDGLRQVLAPHLSDRVLLNFLGDPDIGEGRTRAAFPAETWACFQAVKREYDPQNRFCFSHNIAPATVE